MNVSEYLNKNIKVTIDRKMGSNHPKYGFIYPVNYGFVPNTISGDGTDSEFLLQDPDGYLLRFNN